MAADKKQSKCFDWKTQQDSATIAKLCFLFLTKLSALIDALDGLQAIRKQGGARSRNIQKEQEEQQELPIDTDKVFRYIQQLESGQNIQPQDADLMRRGVQSLTANRQTLNPQAILQLLTILT